MLKMKQTRGAVAASERTKQQHSPGYHKSNTSHCNGENGRESGENSPIYHELDPVVVAGEPPLSFHAYQSIVDVQSELVQLRSSGSANSFDAATTTGCVVTPSQSYGDVTGHVNAANSSSSGSKWTLFSRLRLPRRTTATTGQQQGHVISTSDRTPTSPPHSAPAISGYRCTPPSCCPTSCRGETVPYVTRADYVYLSTGQVRRHVAPAPGGNSPRRDVSYVEQHDGEIKRRGRRRLVNSSPFSSPCCGVRMAEIRAAWRIQSCGPRIVSDLLPTYVTC